MKKILLSIAVIGAISALVTTATVSYFSDTETSSGNTFSAGSIDLKIDNQCHYYDGDCPQGSEWELTDLENGVYKFFNFEDIKPGAWGEDTVSLHVYNNDAWGWMKIFAIDNDENGCTEPEGEVDTSCGDPGEGDGELAQNMNFLIWMDDGNNQYEAGEKKIYEGTLEDYLDDACVVWQLDGNPSSCNEVEPLQGSQTYYIGIKWCFGNFDSNYNCNGTSIGNEAQSDSLDMGVSFVVVQSQNNPNAEGGPTCQ